MPPVVTKDGNALLVNPHTGKQEWVPMAEAQVAVGEGGWSPVTPQQREAEIHEEVYGGFGGGVEALIHGGGRGLTFGLSDELFSGLSSPEHVSRVGQVNPTASTVGEVGGLVGGAFIPGAPLRGVARVGQAVRGATTGLKGLARSAAAGAVEGGIVSGTMAATEPARNPDVQAADTMARMLEGMALGAGINVVGFGLLSLGRFVGSRGKSAAAKLGLDLDKAADVAKQRRELQKTIKSDAAAVNAALHRAGVDVGSPALADTVLAGKAPGFGSQMMRAGKGTQAATPAAKRAAVAADDLSVTGLHRKLEDIGAQKSVVAKEMAEAELTGAMVPGYQAAKVARADAKLGELVNKEAAYMAALSKRGIERYAVYRMIRNFAGTPVAGGAITGGLLGGGLPGAILGAVIAPIVVRAVSHGLLPALGKMAPKVARAVERTAPIIRGGGAMAIGDYEDIRDELAETSPEKLADRAQMMMPPETPPELRQEMLDDTMKSVAYLQQKMPKPPSKDQPLDERWQPSDEQLDSLAKTVKVLVDRQQFAIDFANREATEEGLDVMRNLEPEALKQFRNVVAKVVETAINGGHEYTTQDVRQIALLMGNRGLGPAIDHPAVQMYIQQQGDEKMASQKKNRQRNNVQLAQNSFTKMQKLIEGVS